MARAVIALGSNIPPRREQLARGVRLLHESGDMTILSRSRIYETEPVGGPPQGLFLNAALLAETKKQPLQLLDRLLETEKALGRIRGERNGPRTIDLDLIFYDSLVRSWENLSLPHPRFRERGFVLFPLMDIIPAFVDPVTGLSISDLVDAWLKTHTGILPIRGRL